MTQRGAGDDAARDGVPLQELAGAVVHGVYRVVKACQFHADVGNDAVTSLTASATNAVVEYCTRAATETVALSFLGDAIFVNRQILKASRDTHALAAELRDLLATCEVTELTLSRKVDRAGISGFAKMLADAQRDRAVAAQMLTSAIPGIAPGKARFAATGAAREETPGQRAARTYATAVLTVSSVLADVRVRKFELPRRIKRVAQQMVARADEDARLLVALAATGGVSLDSATIAVGSAILAVAMTRQLTTDRAVLANGAMTALLYDAGRVVMRNDPADAAQRVLNDDELDKVPTRSVLALTALGRMHAPARARTTLLYEVWSMRRAHRLGGVYGGRRPPTLLARIIGVARAFAELRAAGAGGGLSIDDALQMLGNRAADGTERALVKLLIGSLGIYPAGTMVTLNTGELGVVMGTPAMPLDYVRPPVKILYDEHANLLETPIDVDLAQPHPDQPPRFIWKSVDADEQQMKAMRAFVVAAQAAKRRGALDPAESTQAPASQRSQPSQQPRVAHPSIEPDELAARTTAPPEPTLQSTREEIARRVERAPQVREATPAAARVADLRGAPPESSRGAPPSARRPGALEPTPRSAHVVAVASPPAPAPARRRDPRNDSDPPSSMQDDVLGPVRPVRPARVPPVVPAPPPAPAQHTEATRQMNWESAIELDPDSKPTAPPPAAEAMHDEEIPQSKHDDLLAAFLADAPIASDAPPPPEQAVTAPPPDLHSTPTAAPPRARNEKVTIKRDPKG